MDCIACGTPGTRVKDSQDDGAEVKRKRTCTCGAVFFSTEVATRKTLRVPISRQEKESVETGGQQAPPIPITNPPLAQVALGGVGVGLPSGLSGSDPNLPSGPSQPPDLQGDRPPAREPDPDPNDIRLPVGEVTGWNLAKVFGRVRGRDFPGGFGWTVPKSSPGKAEGIVTEANADPSVRADIVPTMALLFAKAKAGKLGAGTDIQDPTVAFGWWVSKFTKLREELHRAPTATTPNGFARSEYPEVRR